MYKNQLQELAQRSCFNLPSYACIKEGPNHAPRFKASVNFNGEIFESQTYCTTLRQAEHSAAEFALNVLSSRGPSRSLTARVLDETGIYKNLLQETAHRAGLKLPVYTTVRSGPGHVPTFTCSVEIASMSFTGDPAKTKKQAEKNAAIAAWSALNRVPGLVSKVDSTTKEEQAKKRMVRGSGSHDVERWKLMDLIMDLGDSSKEDLCCSLQKHRSNGGFASLVPPPPPRTASKILPPRPIIIPVQVRSIGSHSSHVVRSPPLEDHLKDEEEWLGTSGKKIGADDLRANESGQLKGLSESRVEIPFGSVRYVHPHKIAPAVQIRSVIPVCSAPPPQSSHSQSQPKAFVSTTQPSGSSSSSSSKLNNDPLLGTEFNKLQL